MAWACGQDAKAPAPFPLVVEESHGEAETQAASKPVEGPVNGLAGEKVKKPSKMWTLSLPNSKKGKEGDKGQAAGQEEERKGKKGHSKWAMHWGSKGKDKGKQDKARAEEQGEGKKEREERPMSLLDRTQALISTLLSSPHELKVTLSTVFLSSPSFWWRVRWSNTVLTVLIMYVCASSLSGCTSSRCRWSSGASRPCVTPSSALYKPMGPHYRLMGRHHSPMEPHHSPMEPHCLTGLQGLTQHSTQLPFKL